MIDFVKEEKPHVVILLDASGSMQPHEEMVVSTFNEYVQSVKDSAETISLFMFDSNGIREKFFKKPIAEVPKLARADYKTGAMTPLYDAMGLTMKRFESESRVQFVTHTDGFENASKEWNFSTINDYTKSMTAKGWLFVYLAEGIAGKAQMKDFAGVKMNYSSGARGQAMNTMGDITRSYNLYGSAAVEAKTHGGILDIDQGEKLKP